MNRKSKFVEADRPVYFIKNKEIIEMQESQFLMHQLGRVNKFKTRYEFFLENGFTHESIRKSYLETDVKKGAVRYYLTREEAEKALKKVMAVRYCVARIEGDTIEEWSIISNEPMSSADEAFEAMNEFEIHSGFYDLAVISVDGKNRKLEIRGTTSKEADRKVIAIRRDFSEWRMENVRLWLEDVTGMKRLNRQSYNEYMNDLDEVAHSMATYYDEWVDFGNKKDGLEWLNEQLDENAGDANKADSIRTLIEEIKMANDKNHGGARQGAGRKPGDRRGFTVRLTVDEHEEFVRRGGSEWLRKLLRRKSPTRGEDKS